MRKAYGFPTGAKHGREDQREFVFRQETDISAQVDRYEEDPVGYEEVPYGGHCVIVTTANSICKFCRGFLNMGKGHGTRDVPWLPAFALCCWREPAGGHLPVPSQRRLSTFHAFSLWPSKPEIASRPSKLAATSSTQWALRIVSGH